MVDVVLPREVTNDYRGGVIPFVGFCLLFGMQVFKSTVHLLKFDSGVNSIASIIVFPFEGSADPNNVIYMFSAVGGVNQMMFAILYALVLWRYRSLIPLMLGFMLLETLFGLVVTTLHPLTPDYYEYVPPAMSLRIPLLIVIPTLLMMAIQSSRASSEDRAFPSSRGDMG